MKKFVSLAISVVAVIVMLFAFTGCDDFTVYDLDVFGLYTPEIMQKDSADVYDDAYDKAVAYKEFMIDLELISDYDESTVPAESNDEYADKTEIGCIAVKGENFIIDNGEFTMAIIGNTAYQKMEGQKVKITLGDEELEMAKSSINWSEALPSMLIKPDESSFDDAKIKKDGDLFVMEISLGKEDMQDEDKESFVSGKLVVKFNEDGDMVYYKGIIVSASDNGVKCTQTRILKIKTSDYEVKAPADASEYTELSFN